MPTAARGCGFRGVLDPLQFMARLASLISPPRHSLVRYFGVLCAASRWRPHVVPAAAAERICPCASASSQRGKQQQAIHVMGCAPAKQPEPEPVAGRRSRGCLQAATRYIPWADLLKRVHNIDALCCPKCGGRLRMIALILDKEVVRRILQSLGLPCEPPVVARARAPTLFDDPPPADHDAA